MRTLATLISALLVAELPRILSRTAISKKNRSVGRLLFLLYVIAVVTITLGIRTYAEESRINLHLFQWYKGLSNQFSYLFRTYGFVYNAEQFRIISTGITTVLLNVLLFVPLGYLLPWTIGCFDKWWKVFLAGTLATATIETCQLLLHRGCFDVDDLVLNLLGTMIGWLIFTIKLKDRPA